MFSNKDDVALTCVHVPAGADLLRSWFAGFLRSREIAEIDKAIQKEQGGPAASSSSSAQGEDSTERKMGPLQVGVTSSVWGL